MSARSRFPARETALSRAGRFSREDPDSGKSRRLLPLDPAARLPLVRPDEERKRCAQQDLQVDERRTVLHVPDVQLDALVPGQPRAAVDLRPAGNAGLDLKAPPLAPRVALDLVAQGRPRA